MTQQTDKNKVLYSAAQTPPPAILILSSLQHMLLVLSLGMAMPVSIARAAGLDVSLSASLLAAALFSMGFTSILQTMRWRFVGSGYQSLSVGDSAAISACIMAVELGGVPLLLGMTIFSGVLRFGLMYDQLQVKLQIRTEHAQLTEADFEEAALTSLSLSIIMLRNMFDNVRLSIDDGAMTLYVDADV